MKMQKIHTCTPKLYTIRKFLCQLSWLLSQELRHVNTKKGMGTKKKKYLSMKAWYIIYQAYTTINKNYKRVTKADRVVLKCILAKNISLQNMVANSVVLEFRLILTKKIIKLCQQFFSKTTHHARIFYGSLKTIIFWKMESCLYKDPQFLW